MKYRILFIVPLPPPVHGSAMVCQQIKESAAINAAFCCDYVNLSTSRRIDEIGKTSWRKLWRFISSYFIVLWKLLFHHYDLCYLAITCHGIGFLKDAPYVLLCKLFRPKIIIHQHNKGMAADVDRWPYRWLLPLVYKDVKVILLSWRLYSDIERIVPRDNVVICPNGIKVNDIELRRERSANAIPHLLFLSNLIESKGVFVLLDALKIMSNQGVQYVCDIVGGESKEIDVKRLIEEVDKRKLNRYVVYHGRKYGEEKEAIFNQSDVFVFPTNDDCFPLVLLEAMSHRLPIVTTPEGAIPDEVIDGQNGFICERHNPQSLALCLQKLLHDDELRIKMGEKGWGRLNDMFTEEKFEEKILKILSDSVK